MAWLGASAFLVNESMGNGDSVAFWARVPAGAVDNTGADIPFIVPEDWTLVRTRLLFGYSTTNGGAQLTNSWIVGFGLIAWDGLTDNPLDLGTNVPHPVRDTTQDWIYRNVQPFSQENIVGATNGGSDVDAYQSRAQRKIQAGVGLLAVVGQSSLSIPFTTILNGAVDVRMLFKEP